jgi:glucose-1-phosphate thymidylyltransferase
MKGVILAGGTGSRLHPLTRITNKHLLPIHDRPMVNFAIEALVNAGIDELMLVTGGTHAGESIDAYYEVNDFVRANGANKK